MKLFSTHYLRVIYLGPNYGGGDEDNGDLLQKVPCRQATADPYLCQRLLDTHKQVWVSLLWGHCSIFPGPGVQKVLLVPSKSLFSQSCVGYGISMVGLMVISSKRAYVIPKPAAPSHTQICCTQSPCLYGSPLLTRASTGDTQTQLSLSLCGVSGSWCAQGPVMLKKLKLNGSVET